MRWLIPRVLAAAALVLVLAGGAVAGYVIYVRHQGEDVVGSSTVEFVPTEPTVPPPPPPPPPPPTTTKAPGHHPRPPVVEGVVWPTFGFDGERTRFAPASPAKPPFRRLWTFRGRSLLEFPPAIAYGRLFVATNSGLLVAVDQKTGKAVWHRVSGRCTAASPAVDGGLVFQAYLNRPPCNSKRSDLDGQVVAYDAKTGRVRWRRTIGPTESSPLVSNGLVFVGDWRGKVYALAERTGRIRWSFQTGDKVKGAIAISGRRIYVGSYDGHLYALWARTGKLIWRASGQPRLGSHGTFYSTPAAAYGRVYIGSTDGKVYSFGATSGLLRWSRSTGGYVYASPAVWRERIYAGSYSGWFYALDAATGDVVWRFHANGNISGSATVLHGIVYFATLKRRTYGLDATSGRLLWSFPDGKYSPVVADGKRLYLVGYTRVYGMVSR
jgi:outer membrane protein assembly factor BamB